MMTEIPLSLVQAIESGKCVLFIGAGIGEHVTTNGKPLPKGAELAKELCQKFHITESDNLAAVSRVVELDNGRPELEGYIHKRFSDPRPDETFQWLLSLRWKAIYTTNYDESIIRAFEINPKISKKPVVYSLSNDIVDIDPRIEIPVVHLHGCLYGEHRGNIVITSEDYITYKDKRHMLFDLFKRDIATSTILYIGYSNKDSNWNILMHELKEEFAPEKLPNSYRISPTIDALEERILKADGLTSISCNVQDFVNQLKSQLSGAPVIDNLDKFREGVPQDFHAVFDENPAATMRLFNSWIYVNNAAYDEKPNLQQFLKGDKANWGLVGNEMYFQRDIGENLYDECLEYLTSSSKIPSALQILAPAGYGTTTLLMSLAVRLIKQKAGRVFYLKEGSNFNQGDVEFAVNCSSNINIFIIDNAARYKGRIQTIIHRLKESGKPTLFILGSRRNEWHQAISSRVGGKEFNIDILSDGEIVNLLDFLGNNASLGVLEKLSRELQIAAIKTKLGHELLVVMREATEGRAFDAILEDEFRNIDNEFAQRIYLVVCCFFQFGSLLRVGLLAQILKVSETDIYPIMQRYLEGVIVYEEINSEMGVYAVRPRHRKIAEIVWERCGEKSEQEKILQSSLYLLNLNYLADQEAFESFIRSDKLIDSISTLDGKIKFFDSATKKDPTNAYIWQHYARMFCREKLYDMALEKIDSAIAIDSKRILFHTKGKILADIACNEEGIDIARKRLVQSEAAFNHGLNLKNNDDYCLHGLAELYFNWAKCVKDIDESNEYLAKAEKQISEGLKIAQNKEMLLVLSSEIFSFLGDNPAKMKSLIKAAAGSSANSYSRYLLGRLYVSEGKYQEACDILFEACKANPEDYRVSLEYAKALLGVGKEYADAIAVLNLSTLQGYKNAYFISMLGGLFYLDGKYSEAKKIFKESDRQSFLYGERVAVGYRPSDKVDIKKPLIAHGKVASIKGHTAFIEVVGHPENIICPGSKWGRETLKAGMSIDGDLVFSADGPRIINPREVRLLV